MIFRKKWIILAGTVLAVILILAGCGNDNRIDNMDSNMDSNMGSDMSSNMMEEAMSQPTQNEGQAAPMFELTDLDGNEVTLANLSGEKVYIKYWASWCSICLAGMDELNTLSTSETDFRVLSIVSPNYNGEKSTEDFTKWFKSLQADQTAQDITVLLDEDGTWAREFGIRGYPTSLYIGSDGVLVKSVPGHNTNEAIIESFNTIY